MARPPGHAAGLAARARRGLAGLARRARDLLPGPATGFASIAPVLSGVTVTPQTALNLTSVFCAINVIATDVAKLPFSLVETLPSGGIRTAAADRRNRLLSTAPNPEMNALRYRQHQMGHVLGWGNHYSEIIRDGDGFPTALWPLNPATMRPMRDAPGTPLYYEDSNTRRRWRAEDILHIAGLGFDGISGYSPVTMARQAIGLAIGAEQFGATLFGNGAIPKGILKTAKKLSEMAMKRLRDTFYEIHGGQNSNRTAVLEDGLEWQSTQIAPDDAQFLATRQFQVIEIARMFNLPPHKLGDYSQSHKANVEESNLDYLSSTLQGWLETVEAEYDAKLLFADEQGRIECRHDMKALMRGNMTARGAYYESRFRVGSISPDEIRAAEGENPIGPARGGDKYLIQAQYVELSQAGLAMAPKSPTESPRTPAGTSPTPPPAPQEPEDAPK